MLRAHPAPGRALRLAVSRHDASRSCTSSCRPWSSTMGDAFPELKQQPAEGRASRSTTRRTSFLRTLERGIKLFNAGRRADAAEGGNAIVSGDGRVQAARHLRLPHRHHRSRWPQEQGLTRGHGRATSRRWRTRRSKARQGGKKFVVTAVKGELPPTDDSPKYEHALDRREGRSAGSRTTTVVTHRHAEGRRRRSRCCSTARTSTPSRAARSATPASIRDRRRRRVRGRGHAAARRHRAARRHAARRRARRSATA